MTEHKPSKTALKRRYRELQALGESLIRLDRADVDCLPVSEALKAAVQEAKRMRSHSALRRQKQLIGKLMRDVEPGPLEAALARRAAASNADKRVFADAERWRDRIVREGRAAVVAFEQAAGITSPELADLVDRLARAGSDKDLRTLRRQIFRTLHQTLLTALHNDRLPR